MAFPPPTPPLNKKETEEFLQKIESFELSESQRAFFEDAKEFYKRVKDYNEEH